MMYSFLAVVFFVFFVFCLSPFTFAEFYNYNEKIDIDAGGKTIGYVEAYKISSIFGEYAYLKWKRDGYPEGNTFPVFLVKGTYVPLVFGVELEFLNVEINDITSDGLDLTIDKSSLEETIETAVETVPGSVESLVDETPQIVETAVDSVSKEVNAFNEEMVKRATKFVNRGYYSSLHIVDSKDKVSLEVSKEVKDMEARLAEKVSDKVIPLVIDSFVAGIPLTNIAYNQVVGIIPPSVRHDLTRFLLNIDTKNDNYADSELGGKGVYTLYIGNPSLNSLSASLNDELKKEGLPHFDNGNIVGERTYSEDSVGIIAAIPEERVWRTNTLEERLNDDRVRLYKTLIAGIGDDGTVAAGEWYNDQLELVMTSISAAFSLGGDLDIDDVLMFAGDTASSDPEASFCSAALLQGWVMAAANSLESPDLSKIDSLGYVVIVKKDKMGYDVLEVHTITGHKSDSFLYDYEPIEGFLEGVDLVGGMMTAPENVVVGVEKMGAMGGVAGKNIEDESALGSASKATGKVVGAERKEDVNDDGAVGTDEKYKTEKADETDRVEDTRKTDKITGKTESDSTGFIGSLGIKIKSFFGGLFGWLR